MDNENRNDVLVNQNPQNITPNPDPMMNGEIINNTNDVQQIVNSGPIIETIPDNNIEQPINSTPQVEPIETLDVPSVAEPTPIIEQNSLQDNFNAVPKPPIFETENNGKKKGNKKLLFIILIIALIAIVGIGIYYFLVAAKTNIPGASINIKEIKIELGNELSENIDDYATITGYNKNECTLDIENISLTKVGAYKFYITCGNDRVEGNVIVDDTTNPEVVLNEVVVLPNSTITANDFIDTCIDASVCTYKISDEENFANLLKTIGEHDIEILISDEYNNETAITAKLIVAIDAPIRYITCTSKLEDIEEIYATLVSQYKLGISMNNKIYNITKNAEFTFTEIEDYNAVKNDYDETIGIHNIIGQAVFNKNNKSISIKSKKTLDELNTELNLSLTDDINITQMYLAINGYTCK